MWAMLYDISYLENKSGINTLGKIGEYIVMDFVFVIKTYKHNNDNNNNKIKINFLIHKR